MTTCGHCGAPVGGSHSGIADSHGTGRTGFCPNDPRKPDDECENCGMIDEPLLDGHCAGCTCLRCGANGTMSAMGWCAACEELVR